MKNSGTYLAMLTAGLVFASVAVAQPNQATHATTTLRANDAVTAQIAPQIARTQDDWRQRMVQLPAPKIGCFNSSFPKVEWREVPCTAPPNHPYPPARGVASETVGGNTDFSAEVTATLTGAQGSFDSVTGVTSESGIVDGSGSPVANTYSLQLNVKPFATSVCGLSPNSGCRGWQQFIYSNSGSIFIQYWLLQYNTTCPSGWNTFSFSGSTDIYCWKNAPTATTVPTQAITNLASLRLAANASTGGNDSVVMTTSGGVFTATNNDNVLNLASAWKGIEFIVVGDCCSSEANFNAGSTIVVRTTTHSGTTSAPNCVLEGFTGETNNLSLSGAPVVGTGAAPAIVSTQTNNAGTTASCAAASGIGDTHLTTFGGLLYDFQATGDFLLAQTGPDFQVQTRQISGAPTWPNAAVNQAVAVQAGKSHVAVCLPNRVAIDGRTTELQDGKLLSFPDGGDVVRHGNAYTVRAPGGDSMRAVVNSTYIDVSVGLGRWPTSVDGLLANAPGRGNAIAARDGAVLTSPFVFQTLYGHYADSWRVPANESLLSACSGTEVRGIPQQVFTSAHLDPQLAKRTQAICLQRGVKAGPLLDACTLDVAVIGNEEPVQIFTRTRVPLSVARISAPLLK